MQARRRAQAVDAQAAYGGQQVGAEGDVGTATALQDLQHLDERLGHEVLDVTGGDELAGEPPGGPDVALEELSVGVGVPASDGRDELGVARGLHLRRHAHGDHTVSGG